MWGSLCQSLERGDGISDQKVQAKKSSLSSRGTQNLSIGALRREIVGREIYRRRRSEKTRVLRF